MQDSFYCNMTSCNQEIYLKILYGIFYYLQYEFWARDYNDVN